MTAPRHIAVIDIGKTNAKLALVDLDALEEIAVVTRPNTVVPGPPWPHFDVAGHRAFLLEALAAFHRAHRIDAISVTTHGASVVLLDDRFGLAAPILDYEHDGPEALTEAYDRIRPPFAVTGSPRLAAGLNVGAQLHWQFHEDPALRDRTAHVLTYPQYWGHWLTGEIACDVTSIGCHTDLWQPSAGTVSDLAEALGLAGKMAPVRRSTDILGTILPGIADATGLPRNTPVAVGIHDSNASLYPHILAQAAPFSVVSTGTWVITMAVGGTRAALDPDRDTLVNVNALGDPVPSARFMGGREYEIVQAGGTAEPTGPDIAQVLASSLMVLPAVEPRTGPFRGCPMRWTGPEPAVGSGQRAAALSFYLALMTNTCLRLTGAEGPTIVEGPFARNGLFTGMLGAATGRPVLQSGTATGTSIGAALLFADRSAPPPRMAEAATAPPPGWGDYAEAWRRCTESRP
ncbi:FGGY-family carbohydrate kinase [Roseisalinus antarcticus]|uniref:L-fuculokinase n=1 Tax=Roseisalinus antarcticus TaxID=254357 RepID=A0A1Y5T0J8_9RHOB|nr:FGGY-family carbohydrate kinase [Roseisalinus antarcticus]SLN53190.1 L-fuculokinase [Roseisalinus antarcticus]